MYKRVCVPQPKPAPPPPGLALAEYIVEASTVQQCRRPASLPLSLSKPCAQGGVRVTPTWAFETWCLCVRCTCEPTSLSGCLLPGQCDSMMFLRLVDVDTVVQGSGGGGVVAHAALQVWLPFLPLSYAVGLVLSL